jgi:hypothetical protein
MTETFLSYEEIKNQVDAIHARRNNQPTNIMQKTQIFANKSDLEAAEKKVAILQAENSTLKKSPLGGQVALLLTRVSQLEAENKALKTRPLAIVPRTTSNAATATTAIPTRAGWKASAQSPKLTRVQFNTLSSSDQMAFSKAGGTLTEK